MRRLRLRVLPPPPSSPPSSFSRLLLLPLPQSYPHYTPPQAHTHTHIPPPPLNVLAPSSLSHSFSSSSSSTTTTTPTPTHKDKDTDNKSGDAKNEDQPTTHTPSGDFSIIAADTASHLPPRRFNISTSTKDTHTHKERVPVFRELTRNRDPSWEREMEHTTFVSYLPKQLQQYEEEQQHKAYRNNPLVRDQSRLIINKNDASHRRWLNGPQGENIDGTSNNYMEREALLQKERLSAAQGAVYRRGMGDDMGVPEEGMSVEEKIQLAMAQGDFDDLKGKGKPLERFTNDGQYFESATSHRYMDILAKSGMKPVWVDRGSRIKQMQSLLLRRLQAEWAKFLLAHTHTDTHTQTEVDRETLKEIKEEWRERMEGLKCVKEDCVFVNEELDLYNLQVPSMMLQRVRVSLKGMVEEVLEEEEGGGGGKMVSVCGSSSVGEGGGGGGGKVKVNVAVAQAVVRAAEKEGLMSSVTALGGLRLEAEEEKGRGGVRRRRRGGKGGEEEGGEEGRGRVTMDGIWGGGRKGGGERRGGGGGGGGSGLLDSLASWFSSSTSVSPKGGGGGGEGKK